jgi:hypothetical protein
MTIIPALVAEGAKPVRQTKIKTQNAVNEFETTLLIFRNLKKI